MAQHDGRDYSRVGWTSRSRGWLLISGFQVRVLRGALSQTRDLNSHGSVESPRFPALSVPCSQEHSIRSLRMEATERGQKRPPTATESAAALLPDDPGLTAVIEASD